MSAIKERAKRGFRLATAVIAFSLYLQTATAAETVSSTGDTTAVTLHKELPRATMKSNSKVSYFDEPGEVDSFGELFSEGKFYGRLRSNTFYFWWNKEDSSHDIHLISGLGGSVVYQSAIYSGFDFGAGLYYSHGFFKSKNDSALFLKAGKDVFSRYEFLKTGNKNMAALGQAYLRYTWDRETQITAGRQIVESFYTKSNDTKMIPNTFDGLVFNTEAIPDTKIQLAYLAAQKLRDHTESHAVLMYGDCASDGCFDPSDLDQAKVASLSENDDSAMHRGLTYSNLLKEEKPTDAPLITGDFHTSFDYSFDIDASFYVVPELLSQAMVELNHEMTFGPVRVIPGVRYIKQFDLGAGAVGGASLSGDLNATNQKNYTDYDSLESQMIAARLVFKVDNYKVNFGYSYILDEADLVTPWRGFPTAGYTRSMARYNWKANTKSYRAEVVRCTSTDGVYNDVYVQASVLFQDNDEEKNGLLLDDSLYYYLGLMQNIEALDNLQWRFRIGFNQYLNTSPKTVDSTEFSDNDLNNLDTRFEINYFF